MSMSIYHATITVALEVKATSANAALAEAAEFGDRIAHTARSENQQVLSVDTKNIVWRCKT
jgi:hypothetical protein